MSPDVCDEGTYSPSSIKPCEPCGRGTYQPNKGGKGCVTCPYGMSTVSTGSSFNADCKCENQFSFFFCLLICEWITLFKVYVYFNP